MKAKYDFGGWATRNNLKCSDGRTILKDAFKHHDGQTVPLVWNHKHNDPFNVLGHALLENREEGVYAHCKFNDTESGSNAKLLVEHGDITSLSIYANRLKQVGSHVQHGIIREVSLVLSGANPGAFIDAVMQHDGDEACDDEAIIYTGKEISLAHADDEDEPKKVKEDKKVNDKDDRTVEEIFNTLTEEQKQVVYYMIGAALEENGGDAEHSDIDDSEGGDVMKHNVFDKETQDEVKNDVLSHSEMEAIFADVKRYGSLRDSVLAHGIDDIDWLFPEAKNLNTPPHIIQRDMGWVPRVMGGVHHTPFSRIKSMFADLTEDEARAKGYIKGNLKKEQVFGLLKRATTPQTIYKKQKLDRDDVVDITDFDVVAWLKAEMRTMLDEEIARAILVGDGRPTSSDDKINEQNIRPIWKDDDLFTIKARVTSAVGANVNEKSKAFIRAAIKARKDYKGSGEPILFTTEDILTDCLLIEDNNGRVIYESISKLATTLRVREIITVPIMENLSRIDGPDTLNLIGIIVNLSDYNVGADKGGAVSMFEDFDIDYNAQKYLIETRCSGALIRPFSAIVLEEKV